MQTTDYQHEVQAWKRIIEFIKEENVYLKNCLADILKYEVNSEQLKKAEYFLSKFLYQDEVIKLLLQHIRLYQVIQENESEHGASLNVNFLSRHIRFRRGTREIELEFNRLKFSFFAYSDETLLTRTVNE